MEGEVVYAQERRTNALRWRNGILEQQWIVDILLVNRWEPEKTEWRPVPTVEE